jgi:hypothetical protein
MSDGTVVKFRNPSLTPRDPERVKVEEEWNDGMIEAMNVALAEAKRRNVPLHEILPVP